MNNKEVQCNLPSAKPSHTRDVPYVSEQILWTQRNVFYRGRFISVRELGTQTDPVGSVSAEYVPEQHAGLTFDSVFENMPAPSVSDGPNARLSLHAPGPMCHEGRKGSRKSTRSSVSNTSRPHEVTEPTEREIQETQQYISGLTGGALDRACALEEHVEDLNRRASAALLSARQFQSNFKINNAFDCSRSRPRESRGGSTGYSDDESSQRNSGRANAAVPTTLPELGMQMPMVRSATNSKSSGGDLSPMQSRTSTKMPWTEWQDTMTGSPNAALGCKVMLSAVDPWRPAVLSALPAVPRLTERIAVSASIYSCGGMAKEGRESY